MTCRPPCGAHKRKRVQRAGHSRQGGVSGVKVAVVIQNEGPLPPSTRTPARDWSPAQQQPHIAFREATCRQVFPSRLESDVIQPLLRVGDQFSPGLIMCGGQSPRRKRQENEILWNIYLSL